MRASNLMKKDGSNESAMMVFAHAHVYRSLCTNSYVLRRRNTRYKNPQLVAQHCFVASFGSMFRVFHLSSALSALFHQTSALLFAIPFFNLQQMFLLRDKLIANFDERRQNRRKLARRNNVARQVEGFCISNFAAWKPGIATQKYKKIKSASLNFDDSASTAFIDDYHKTLLQFLVLIMRSYVLGLAQNLLNQRPRPAETTTLG